MRKNGLEGLKPNFGGGRPSILIEDIKKEIKERILAENNLNMTDVKNILANEKDIHF